MERKLKAKEPIAIPVYKPNSGIFDHFIYYYDITLEDLIKKEPKPGDLAWDRGIAEVRNSFEQLKNGTWSLYDLRLVLRFAVGDCMGGTSCQALQTQVQQFFNALSADDEEFIRRVSINPNLLNIGNNLARLIRIIESLPSGPLKEMLKGFLCRIPKFQYLELCGGNGERFFLNEAIEILNEVERPTDTILAAKYDELVAVVQKFEKDDAKYQAGNLKDETFGNRLLKIEEKAEKAVSEFWELVEASEAALPEEAKAFLTQEDVVPVDSMFSEIAEMVEKLPQTSNPELLNLAGEMRDFQSKAKRAVQELKKKLSRKTIDQIDYDDAILLLQKEFSELKKKFRDFINASDLPASVEQVRRCDGSTAEKIRSQLGDDPALAQFRVLAKVFGEFYEEVKKTLNGQ